MFIDTREINEAQVVATTVCIIGAGVAGITLARELEKKGIDTCVLESGGFHADDATRDLYRGESIGQHYHFADGCRTRFLGGSSNCWGGWCRPLDAWDFEKKSWVPFSGWPFGLDTLAPYYQKAHQLLELGPINFDPAYWEAAIQRDDVRRIPFVSGRVRDTISQFSPPVRFGKRYRRELKNARSVRVYLHANVTQLVKDPGFDRITHVQVRTLSGRSISVAARIFVLATGGIENARLLLASGQPGTSLGNRHDLVGRFFMDHPRMLTGKVRFRPEWSRNKLYDIKYNYMNAAVAAQGVHIAAQFALTPETLQQEHLLNARVCFCSEFPGEASAGAKALFRCKQALLDKEQPGWSLRDDMLTMLKDPANTFAYGFTRVFHPRSIIRNVGFQVIIEPAPDPESRVRLSSTERDALGMPRVQVDWRLNDLVKRTTDRTLALVAQELQLAGVAEVTLDPPVEGGTWPATMEKEGTWHHMGTTRMHESALQGVVDPDCRVHDLANLYVAGSSVFPTAGANFPTITITALSLRLAEHLVSQLRRSSNRIGDAVLAASAIMGENIEVATASIQSPGLPAT